jgi:hypothetical protein
VGSGGTISHVDLQLFSKPCDRGSARSGIDRRGRRPIETGPKNAEIGCQILFGGSILEEIEQ